MNKECHLGKEGMALYRIYCNDCQCLHPQWRYPCDNPWCEDGKTWVKDRFGYAICESCEGNKYLKNK